MSENFDTKEAFNEIMEWTKPEKPKKKKNKDRKAKRSAAPNRVDNEIEAGPEP